MSKNHRKTFLHRWSLQKKLSLKRRTIEPDRPPLDSKMISASSTLSPFLHSLKPCSSSSNVFCPLAIMNHCLSFGFLKTKKTFQRISFQFFSLLHNNDIIGIPLPSNVLVVLTYFSSQKVDCFPSPREALLEGRFFEFPGFSRSNKMNELLHRFIVVIEHNENIKIWCCESDGWSFSPEGIQQWSVGFSIIKIISMRNLERRNELFARNLCVCCVFIWQQKWTINHKQKGSKNLSGICYFFLHRNWFCPF